ncbi:MAG: helix-turn-helix transcriptional regulator [Clostridiales bacterium]|nr:helix-turn-helix transcriptional regulator [Clostridiales bacterium]
MENSLDVKISENIKREIEQSGKSKSEIAKAIGVSKPTVSQYVSGRIQPSLSTLSKLCNFLNISADEILEIQP